MTQEFDVNDQYKQYVLKRYTGISSCRSYSVDMISRIRNVVAEYFAENASDRDQISCIAVCGSMGRLEASQNSDLDLITVGIGDADVEEIHKKILALINSRLNMPLPNPKGVFASPSSTQILSKSSGDQEEHYRPFSQRILFILESKWIWNKSGYDENMMSVVDAYAKQVDRDRRKNYVFLLNDVIRYFRTVCVNYQFNTEGSEWGKWPIRNVKLRHSRVLMYFSMLAAIGELSTEYGEEKKKRLCEYIALTPLERIFQVYQENKDHSWFRLFGHYDTFLRLMGDANARPRLNELEYADRYACNEFATLKANSDGLAAEIVRFILDRRQQWSDRFFEYIII